MESSGIISLAYHDTNYFGRVGGQWRGNAPAAGMGMRKGTP